MTKVLKKGVLVKALCVIITVAMFMCTYMTDVRITFAASSDAALLTLTYNGLNLKDFESGNFKGKGQREIYNIELPAGTTEVPEVKATAKEGVDVEINNAESIPGTTEVFVKEGEVNHYYDLVFTIGEIPITAYYSETADGGVPNWSSTNQANAPTTGFTSIIENGNVKLAMITPGVNHCNFDENAENYAGQTLGFTQADALYHTKVIFPEKAGVASSEIRFGIMMRGFDGKNHATIAFDAAKVSYHAHVNGTAKNHDALEYFTFKYNVQYDIKAQITGNQLIVVIDGDKILDYTIPTGEVPTAGTFKFGTRMWYGATTVLLDDMYVAPADPDFGVVVIPDAKEQNQFSAPEAETFETIASADMKVLVGKSYPFVYSYQKPDGTFMANGINPAVADSQGTKLNINGSLVDVNSIQTAKDATSITYQLTAVRAGTDKLEAIDCVITAKITVTNNKLKLEFPAIVENNDTVIRFFALPDNQIVSVAGKEAGAAFGSLTGWGPMADTFIDVNKIPADKDNNRVSYALMYDGKAETSVAFESNSMDGVKKYNVFERMVEDGEGDFLKYVSISNTAWYWHYLGKDVPMIPDYKPYAEVIVGGDSNEDEKIDWQDAGIIYRDIRKVAKGGEDVKNYWNYIAMNMSNSVGNPSLRILDRAKAISYLTDGFGQKIMNKGYQVSGHDDSHGDYDNVSEQQGGKEEFEYLSTVGELYNVKTGIHVNMTEFALDGFETELENMRLSAQGGLIKNWNWIDQAYLVDKGKDISSGDLERRINELKAALPNLDWVYVDVYQSYSSYEAKMLAYYLNKAGFEIATEAAGDLEEDVTMLHWNTDLYYPSGGTQSNVIRFMQNDIADKFAPDRAILSMTMPGVSDWRNTTIFHDAQEVFYRNNLAAKYLQHFNLMSWEPHLSATLKSDDGSVTVTSEVVLEDGKQFMYLKNNGNLIAKIDVSKIPTGTPGTPAKTSGSEIFIPWDPETEEKIYYYNDYKTESEWTLPANWAGIEKIYQYKLTDSGREYIGEIVPVGGKVTVTGELSQAYILDKAQNALGGLGEKRIPASEGKWGEGSPILNFGFTGKNFESWTNEGTSIDSTIKYQNSAFSGDPRVEFAATGGFVSQDITIEANKAYSVSVYVSTENRKATLSVTIGDNVYSNYVNSTDIAVKTKPSKYLDQKYERIKVDIPASANTAATVKLNIAAGEGKAYADDFRIWQWTNEDNLIRDQYDAVYEDFENVDQEYGPFVSQVGSQPYFHLAQKDLSEESKQLKDYVIDGEWSFKDQTSGAGIRMRTMPSTLRFKTGSSYRLTLDYQAFREARLGAEAGFSMPLNSKARYSIELRNANGSISKTYTLDNSKFESEEYTYGSKPITNKLNIVIADAQEGMYLTVSRTSNQITTPNWVDEEILIMDNLRIREIPSDKTVLIGSEHGLPTSVLVKLADGTDKLCEVTYTGTYRKDVAGVYNLTGTIDIGDSKAEADFQSTFMATVTVVNKVASYTVPDDRNVVRGSEHGLSNDISVKLADGSQRNFFVNYRGNYDKNTIGEYTLTGIISIGNLQTMPGFSETFTVKVNVFDETASYVKPADKSVAYNSQHGLPENIDVKMASGNIVSCGVAYTGFSSTTLGEQTVTGTIDIGEMVAAADFSKTFTVKITVFNEAASYTKPADKSVNYNSEHGLAGSISVTLADGTAQNMNVAYTGYNKLTIGEQTVTGTIDLGNLAIKSDFSKTFTVKVTVTNEATSYTKPADKNVILGSEHGLPGKINVTLANGNLKECDVTYTGYNKLTVGEQTVTGTIDVGNLTVKADFSNTFTVKVTVNNPLTSYTKPADKTVDFGGEHGLSNKINVTLANGDMVECDVTYSGTYTKDTAGEYTLTGTINTDGKILADGFNSTFTVKVTVNAAPEKGCGSSVGGVSSLIGLSSILLLMGAITVVTLRRKSKNK